MVKRCAHGVCKSDTRFPERLSGGVVFFPFPKPKTQRERCLQWIKQCGRPHSQHFMNGKPTPEFPNPVNAVQGPNPTKEKLGGCRKSPKKRRRVCVQDASSGSISTTDAGESQQHAVESESPEHPPLPGCQLEREREEEQSCQSTEKEKELEAENNNIKLQLSLQETELKSLKAQIGTFKKKTLTPELLQSSEIHKMLEYSTGFTYERFNQLCTIFDIPNDPHTTQKNVPLNYKHNDWQIAEMPLRTQLLFVLMKLRNNEDLKSLAFRFNINMQAASNIFNSWIHYMFDVLGELPIWPHRDVITQNMPETYKVD
ncbi:uncharacterized protein LOC125267090 isoform X2 [Megalobrama amblycephala]|uniref:uncharacterized protein LOC125267090 isoform X2 n=1 Tax=Megalobrama amblycephala TaxID=75352 RepID=UPI0020140D33|nr:uncharacterized protein LOC125267090 isoform X2 [Megalobrama amblycephala]